MHYRDLIQFEPLASVVQLMDADEADAAQQFVASYVISQRMADVLTNLVIPQIQFDTPQDNRGLLIVGNYGTGKSHLMAVISAIAERADLLAHLTDAQVATAAQALAGRFFVRRIEIGSITRRLRDIVLDELQVCAAELGVDVTIPPMDQITNNKLVLFDLIGRLQEHYPDKGVLLVVDELLDYLGSRNDHDLRLDLSFMREVGEVCAQVPFRFIAGVQESIFDTPRFQFVAESLRRVKDRFEQVRIAREDLAFVVEARLLRKSDAQRDRITAHLQQFAPRYSEMSERMERFVRLFPVHPDYLTIFEQISVIEKRQVLQALTQGMQKLLDQEVPTDGPGLLAYDQFWPQIVENPSWRTIPDVREVIDKSQVLERRVETAFDRPHLRPLALQLIHALSVHRLTTGGIDVPIGASPAELRDTLCPITPPPNERAEDVERVIQMALRQVERTVNNQFLSRNESGQYYLDVHKDVDYDALIEQRAESVDAEQMNRVLFETLAELMERPQATYVPGYRIWEYELEWHEHRITRPGYLFFGKPAERSTAQPPRDFYLYVFPLHTPPGSLQEDEVAATLVPDEEFLHLLRHTAAAVALRAASTSGSSQIYAQKIEHFRKQMLQWLHTQGGRVWQVSHGGHTRLLTEWSRAGAAARSVTELINAVAATCLASQFASQRPDYPAFKGLDRAISRNALEDMAHAALQAISGTIPTKQGQAVLEGLELLEGNTLRPRDSRYARHVLELLQRQGSGQVVNRSTLLAALTDYQGNTLAEEERQYRLEPEWLLVVLVALVASGDIVLVLPGNQRIDAGSLSETSRRSLRDLLAFRHIERPRDLPLAALLALFQLLGLVEGLVRDPNQRDEGVRQLQQAVEQELEHTLQTQRLVGQGLVLWNSAVLEGTWLDEVQRTLAKYKEFLETLRPYNTVGKLKNVRVTAEEIEAQQAVRQLQSELHAFAALLQDLQPLTAYLTTAQEVLPVGHAFRSRVQSVQAEQLALLRDPQRRAESGLRMRLQQELNTLKQEYTDLYLALHQAIRLNTTQDDRKKQLLQHPHLTHLRTLAHITLLPRTQLDTWQADLGRLTPCFGLSSDELRDSPVCPRCSFRPIEEGRKEQVGDALTRLEDELQQMYTEWLTVLRTNLHDPVASEGLDLWDNAAIRGSIRDFRDGGDLPEPLSSDWAAAVNTILGGLERLTVDAHALLATLGSTPMTRDDFEQRVRQFLDQQMQGRDVRKVRIVVER
jgi:hypothetical protein